MIYPSNNINPNLNCYDTQNHILSDAEKIKIINEDISKCHTEAERNSLRALKREIIKEQCENNTAGRVTVYNGCNLQGVDLSNLNLSDIDFTNADLRSTNMTNTNLSHAILYGAKLTGIQWNNTNIIDTRVDLDNIRLLPLSAEEQYAKIVECVGEIKSNDTLHQENNAINAFRASLGTESKMQARLSKLDNKQLQILLPYLYVEATHKLNPIIAYNTKDAGFKGCKEDDNALMIKGYTLLLSGLNAIYNDKNSHYEDKVRRVGYSIENLAELLTIQDIINVKCDSSFITMSKSIFNVKDIIDNKIKNETLTLDTLKYKLDIVTNHDNSLIGINGITDGSVEKKRDVIHQFARKLVNAHAEGDIAGIFKLTSDFQYLHLLPNANGRVSQVIRDCFALHLGELPFSMLTNMSHYMYLSEPVDQKHLEFMLKNSRSVLTAIEEKRLTTNIYKEIIDKQKPFIEKNSATHFDTVMFYSEYYCNENAKNNISKDGELMQHDLD